MKIFRYFWWRLAKLANELLTFVCRAFVLPFIPLINDYNRWMFTHSEEAKMRNAMTGENPAIVVYKTRLNDFEQIMGLFLWIILIALLVTCLITRAS